MYKSKMTAIQNEFCHLELNVSTVYAKKVFLMRRKCLGFLGYFRRASRLQHLPFTNTTRPPIFAAGIVGEG
jgi:hypothetical protein